jgi:hypothetical protein
MATRVLLGVVEMFAVISIGCILVWFLFIPQIPGTSTLPSATLGLTSLRRSLLSQFVFFLATLLSTFLDDLWQAWGTFLLLGLIRAGFESCADPQKH